MVVVAILVILSPYKNYTIFSLTVESLDMSRFFLISFSFHFISFFLFRNISNGGRLGVITFKISYLKSVLCYRVSTFFHTVFITSFTHS